MWWVLTAFRTGQLWPINSCCQQAVIWSGSAPGARDWNQKSIQKTLVEAVMVANIMDLPKELIIQVKRTHSSVLEVISELTSAWLCFQKEMVHNKNKMKIIYLFIACWWPFCHAYNQYLGPGFFRQNTSGYALGVLTPKASPSGWVFSQAQHPMIKTFNI